MPAPGTNPCHDHNAPARRPARDDRSRPAAGGGRTRGHRGQLNPGVNLVDTLNGGEFTVFATVDDAFAKVDPATIETLKTDSTLLSTILTHHVVPGAIAPADLVGTQTTVQGGTVEVAGTPDNLTVNGAQVICGGVTTADATVYLIDTVLTPPAG